MIARTKINPSRLSSARRAPAEWISTSIVLLLVLAVILVGCVEQDSSPEVEQAQQILDASGVKGGLIVHVNCGDGKLTATLRANDSYLVHGLDADAKNIEQARKHIQSLKLYGKVSVEQFRGNRLPYTDNLVNLVVSEQQMDVPMDEILRVLVPNGAAYIKKGDIWTKTVKPRPQEMDEWTHYARCKR